MKILAVFHYLVALLNPQLATDTLHQTAAPSPMKEVRIERTVVHAESDSVAQQLMDQKLEREVQVISSDSDVEGIIALLVPIIVVLVLGLIAWKDLDSKKQVRLAMIEKGLDPTSLEASKDATKRYGALRFGLLLVGMSVGLLAGFGLCTVFEVSASYYELIVIATTVFFAGLSMIGYHMIATSLNKHR